MRKLFLTFLILCTFGLTACRGQSMEWATLKKTIRMTYPDVRHISTDSLARWLADSTSTPLLLDTRSADEYEVSHLRGARRLDPAADAFDALEGVPRDTSIVTYCSVGYRSSALAQRLTEAGFTNVVNLEGSLFQWANEGRPVYRDASAVRQVHPYDETWGRLLKDELHAYSPVPNK